MVRFGTVGLAGWIIISFLAPGTAEMRYAQQATLDSVQRPSAVLCHERRPGMCNANLVTDADVDI